MYTTREEADSSPKRKRNTRPVFYCPLIQQVCNPMCLCIGKPYISSDGSGYKEPTKWYIRTWYCSNTMFTGITEE